MFAEELSGNANRKRQEQAKSRRREIKSHQSSRGKEKNASLSQRSLSGKLKSVETDIALAKPCSSIRTTPTRTDDAYSVEEKSNILKSQGLPLVPKSAVEEAAKQRHLRTQNRILNSHAVRIQSFVRSYSSRKKIVDIQRLSFDKKISDIAKLLTILKKKSGQSSKYTSPVACTELTDQLLFFAKLTNSLNSRIEFLLSSSDGKRLFLLIQLVLLPSITTTDEHMQIIPIWMQTTYGRRRLKHLIGFCLKNFAKITGGDGNKNFIAFRFLRSLIGVPNESMKSFSNGLLFNENSDFDVINILRSLLFGVHESLNGNNGNHSFYGIPPQADSLREDCFTAHQKHIMNSFFQFVLSSMNEEERKSVELYSRFVEKIFTVPLLVWKVDVSSLLQKPTKPDSDALKENQKISCKPLLSLFITSFFEKKEKTGSTYCDYFNLPLVDLNKCPSPSILSLLSNVIQLGRMCDIINGLKVSSFDWEEASKYFDFICILLHQAPLGTFTSRTALEWTQSGSLHKPIMLSPVIIDQCRVLLLDSWVRTLILVATDDDCLGTLQILERKDEEDLKLEKEMMKAGQNAMALAADEATKQRGEGVLWHSSKWAKKIGISMTNIFGKDESKAKHSNVETEGLKNTSSTALSLAKHGKSNNSILNHVSSERTGNNEKNDGKKARYDISFFLSLCQVYSTILARWGGDGAYDITFLAKNKNEPLSSLDATTSREQCTINLLNVLCFSTNIMKTSWALLQSKSHYGLKDISETSYPRNRTTIRSIKINPCDISVGRNDMMGSVLFFIFMSTFLHSLLITDDAEIENETHFPKHQIRRCIRLLKKILYRACSIDFVEQHQREFSCNYFGLAFLAASSKLMRDLYDRSSRRPICLPKHWLIDDLLVKELSNCKTHKDYVSLLHLPVLSTTPYFVPFQRRLIIFNHIITTSRSSVQGSRENNDLKPGITITISRNRILEDGLLYLNKLGYNALRQRLIVTYLNEAGARETGVDAGGLFKDFWCDLCALAFDPNFALFKTTSLGSGTYLYPNPSSAAAHGNLCISLFEFLGRILGKALYEGITIQPQFTHVFLSFLRGNYNYMHMLSDLSTIDPVLYNNLMFLKSYEDDVSALALTFAVANDEFGVNNEIELIPNGANVDVTSSNKQRYISLLAKHHVYDCLREQAEGFTRGLWDVIDKEWLRIFNEPELQVLISGSTFGKLDLADLKANTRYTGGYTVFDRNIVRFWNVLSNLNTKHQAQLLKFVTSCERPPASGFSCLNPPFTIQRVGLMVSNTKLPSASTCFNTLKLPPYSSEKIMRERLIYSIEAGAGFELT